MVLGDVFLLSHPLNLQLLRTLVGCVEGVRGCETVRAEDSERKGERGCVERLSEHENSYSVDCVDCGCESVKV